MARGAIAPPCGRFPLIVTLLAVYARRDVYRSRELVQRSMKPPELIKGLRIILKENILNILNLTFNFHFFFKRVKTKFQHLSIISTALNILQWSLFLEDPSLNQDQAMDKRFFVSGRRGFEVFFGMAKPVFPKTDNTFLGLLKK